MLIGSPLVGSLLAAVVVTLVDAYDHRGVAAKAVGGEGISVAAQVSSGAVVALCILGCLCGSWG